MLADLISVKRHNHRIHPCINSRKDALLEQLILRNSDSNILIISSENILNVNNEQVTTSNDVDIKDLKDQKFDLLISYDLPENPKTYIERLVYASDVALILVDPIEQPKRYEIEGLLGRTLIQEIITGYEPKVDMDIEEAARPKFKRESTITIEEERRPWENSSGDRPKERDFSSKKGGDRKPWEKKEKKESKYMGRDENDKAMFSGKTGDRNHQYDGTPKNKPFGKKDEEPREKPDFNRNKKPMSFKRVPKK
ncbi:MAG: hypothetical protein GQ570_10195 [Helicobacteraceae bacterium]|nr:hypothetical protein [Helicobacteraceae bacterium]